MPGSLLPSPRRHLLSLTRPDGPLLPCPVLAFSVHSERTKMYVQAKLGLSESRKRPPSHINPRRGSLSRALELALAQRDNDEGTRHGKSRAESVHVIRFYDFTVTARECRRILRRFRVKILRMNCWLRQQASVYRLMTNKSMKRVHLLAPPPPPSS